MPKQIILVEDDPAIIDVYQIVMEKARFAIEIMSNGQDVLKRIQEIAAGDKQKPDVLLLDLTLPDMRGEEVLAQIRKTPATKDMKVFILTNQEASVMEGMKDKPDKFIIKANTTPTQLVDIIKKEL